MEWETWWAAQQVLSKLAWLGIQDTAQKHQPPSQESGAWAGSVAHTSNGWLVVLTSQEKWDKTKRILSGPGSSVPPLDTGAGIGAHAGGRGMLGAIKPLIMACSLWVSPLEKGLLTPWTKTTKMMVWN